MRKLTRLDFYSSLEFFVICDKCNIRLSSQDLDVIAERVRGWKIDSKKRIYCPVCSKLVKNKNRK